MTLSKCHSALLSLDSSAKLKESDPDSAASRAYYAAFHAVSALFALRDLAYTKHSAVRAAVHRDLVRTGQWQVRLGQDYDYLMDLRETGDYGGTTHVSTDDAESSLEAASRIVQAVSDACPSLSPPQCQ